MLVSIERMENNMSYVNIDWVKNKIDEKRDIAGNWVDDIDVVPVVNVLYWLDCLDDAQSRGTDPQQPKTPTTSNPKASLHSNITKELNDIYIAKNADYGDAFGETYKKLGVISAVTRITDKVNRLQSLATKSDEERLVKDESIVDTLKDLSNYAILTLIEMGYEPVDAHVEISEVNICKDELIQDPFETNWEEARQNYDTNLKDVLKSFARVGNFDRFIMLDSGKVLDENTGNVYESVEEAKLDVYNTVPYGRDQ